MKVPLECYGKIYYMNQKFNLPVIKKKKKINLKTFAKLAKRVRAYFEEEEEYLESRKKKDEDSNPNRFSVCS